MEELALLEDESIEDGAVVRAEARERNEVLRRRARDRDGVDLDNANRTGDVHEALGGGGWPRAAQALSADGDAPRILQSELDGQAITQAAPVRRSGPDPASART